MPSALIALVVGFSAVSALGLNDFLKVRLMRKLKLG
jgi:hypothetical protein